MLKFYVHWEFRKEILDTSVRQPEQIWSSLRVTVPIEFHVARRLVLGAER